jgi:hypothetical protein
MGTYGYLSNSNSVALVRKRTIPTELATLAERGASLGQPGGSLGRNLAFLDRSRYFFFQVAP